MYFPEDLGRIYADESVAPEEKTVTCSAVLSVLEGKAADLLVGVGPNCAPTEVRVVALAVLSMELCEFYLGVLTVPPATSIGLPFVCSRWGPIR